MALINIDSALQEALRRINSTPIGSGVELMSYKRNRSIALIRTSDENVTLKENGYIDQATDIQISFLKKKLKSAILREFPRSRKVRFHKLNSAHDLERTHQKI